MKITLAVKYMHRKLGGAELMIVHTANILAELGHKVEIVTFEGKIPEIEFPLDSRVALSDGHGAQILETVAENCERNFDKILEDTDFSKKWVSSNKKASCHWGSAVMSTNPDQVIVFMQHSFSMLLPSISGLVPTAISFQNDPSLEFARFSGASDEALGTFKGLVNLADRAIVLLEPFVESVKKFFHGPVTVLPNFTEIVPVERESGVNGRATLIAAGRLAPVKEFSILIEAMVEVVKVHPDALLTIFGAGELHSDLLAKIRQNWLQYNVVMPGSTRRLANFFASSDICVMPSSIEGFGLVAIEAMTCGVPVIVFDDCVALRTVVSNGGGVLVSERSSTVLAGEIIKLIDDENERAKLSAEGRMRAASFTRDSYVAGLAEILETLVPAIAGGIEVHA